MIPKHRPHAKAEQAVYDLIVTDFFPRVRFTAYDVYCHKAEPKDEDLETALAQLEFEKKIQRVARVFDEVDMSGMVYSVAGEDGYRSCFCRDCFDTTIGPPGEFCTECEEAGCTPDSDCARDDAYGFGDEEEGEE